jgi:predicted alpha/beta superfamily hydrolase
VVVVTDANLNFPIAAMINVAMGMQGGKAALIVGVGYAADDLLTPMFRRARDLTPPTPLANIPPNPALPPPRDEDYGGAEDFYRFLVEELRPSIARAYSIDEQDQTLFGHSLGGLFTLKVMFDHPTSFRTFAASSPSIWWNNRALLEDEAGFVAKVVGGEGAPRCLIMIGAEEQAMPAVIPPTMTAEMLEVMLAQARMVDNARELAERLGAVAGGPGYTVRYTAFDAEDHMSVVPGAISRALVFALRG